jgi:hypothetical protein
VRRCRCKQHLTRVLAAEMRSNQDTPSWWEGVGALAVDRSAVVDVEGAAAGAEGAGAVVDGEDDAAGAGASQAELPVVHTHEERDPKRNTKSEKKHCWSKQARLGEEGSEEHNVFDLVVGGKVSEGQHTGVP